MIVVSLIFFISGQQHCIFLSTLLFVIVHTIISWTSVFTLSSKN